MKMVKKCLLVMLSLAMLVTMVPVSNASAKAKIRMSRKSMTLEVEEGVLLRLKGTNSKNITWKSSNPKVAKVNNRGYVAARKLGKATITATYRKKSYKCKVSVVELDRWDDEIEYDDTDTTDETKDEQETTITLPENIRPLSINRVDDLITVLKLDGVFDQTNNTYTLSEDGYFNFIRYETQIIYKPSLNIITYSTTVYDKNTVKTLIDYYVSSKSISITTHITNIFGYTITCMAGGAGTLYLGDIFGNTDIKFDGYASNLTQNELNNICTEYSKFTVNRCSDLLKYKYKMKNNIENIY